MEKTTVTLIMDECLSQKVTDEELGKWIRASINILHQQNMSNFAKCISKAEKTAI